MDADGPLSAAAPGRTLVGRVAERAVLAGCLRSALDGRRQVALIAGEPGAGKTRLAEDAVDQARELGLVCALGRASEDEGSPPYWPFLQVFRGLAGHLPEELYGGLAGGDGAAGTARERFRLFEVTAEALEAAARPSGLLVVLDDLQWADAATVRLMVHLAAGVTPARLMLVATYRDTETGWEVPEPVAAAICRRTRGNPFFVGELGRLLVSSTDGQLLSSIRGAPRYSSCPTFNWR